MSNKLTRRAMITTGLASVGSVLAGCNSSRLIDTTSTGSITSRARRPAIGVDANLRSSAAMYGEKFDGEYTLAAVPYEEMDSRFRRQRVINRTGMKPGTILVDPRNHHAYYVLSHDEAVRYGIGVGKAGFEWTGDAVIGRKAKWPRWTPPAEMIERAPALEKYRNGMDGGIENPLGARALYLFAEGRDTLYRLHGTPEWRSIGRSTSSGCIRLLNQDAIDLFNRVPVGTRVRVI
ncbi:MAG: L,D-transpeptidase [Rhizobiaceae bacterium]